MELVFTGLAVIIGLAIAIAAFRFMVMGGCLFALGCMFAPLFSVVSPISFAPAFVMFIALLMLHGWLNSDVTRIEVRRY